MQHVNTGGEFSSSSRLPGRRKFYSSFIYFVSIIFLLSNGRAFPSDAVEEIITDPRLN